MQGPHPDLTSSVISGLGWLYLLLFFMNVAWTARSFRLGGSYHRFAGIDHLPKAALWSFYSALLLLVATAHFTGTSSPDDFVLRLPEWFKNGVDWLIGNPIRFFALSMVMFVIMIWAREWLVKPTIGWIMLNVAVLFLAVSMTDYDFRQIVGKPDNVPIVGLLYIAGFFTWLYFYKACENDRRLAEGRPLLEEEEKEQVLVWPDLVYTELICMVLVSALLVVWGVALQAPLEEPASSVKTPNPSKAPWYFLGLQEMLVYFDPWMAGVVLPSVILVGLMAIPYIDFNPKGNGYYLFKERFFAVTTFLFGFLPLWVALIILGTFLRGPNWNMFGPYEFWDVHKLEVLNNVNLSDMVWLNWLGQPLPKPDPNAGALAQTGTILMRESLGLIMVLAYLFVFPPLMLMLPKFLGGDACRAFFMRMGFIRYMVLANLALFMMALPLKMLLRWFLNLKYIVAIPEWFFNI